MASTVSYSGYTTDYSTDGRIFDQIDPLVLSDNFHEWFSVTNKIIDAVNPIQLYDIEARRAIDFTRNSSGVVTIDVLVSPSDGINVYTASDGTLPLTLDIRSCTEDGNIENDDLFVIEKRQTTEDGGNTDETRGIIRRVQASNILPELVEGDHIFTGNVVFSGRLTNLFTKSMRVRDKTIELAVPYDSTDLLDTDGTYNGSEIETGGNHTDDSGDHTGGKTDADMSMLADKHLDGAGLTVLGRNVDKEWEYQYKTNSWRSNVNISHPYNFAFVSDNPESTPNNAQFNFKTSQNSDSVDGISVNHNDIELNMFMGNPNVANMFDMDRFQLVSQLGPATEVDSSFTGANSSSSLSEDTLHIRYNFRTKHSTANFQTIAEFQRYGADANRRLYLNNNCYVYNRLDIRNQGLDNSTTFQDNSDGLTTHRVPYTRVGGIIDETFYNRIYVSMASHGFSVGEWIRYDANTVTTDDQQGFAKAKADEADSAEVLGMVTNAPSASTFVYAYAGEIITTAWKVWNKDGTTSASLIAGRTYYLSTTKAGYIQDWKPTDEGYIAKPVLRALSVRQGQILNYRGSINPPVESENVGHTANQFGKWSKAVFDLLEGVSKDGDSVELRNTGGKQLQLRDGTATMFTVKVMGYDLRTGQFEIFTPGGVNGGMIPVQYNTQNQYNLLTEDGTDDMRRVHLHFGNGNQVLNLQRLENWSTFTSGNYDQTGFGGTDARLELGSADATDLAETLEDIGPGIGETDATHAYTGGLNPFVLTAPQLVLDDGRNTDAVPGPSYVNILCHGIPDKDIRWTAFVERVTIVYSGLNQGV